MIAIPDSYVALRCGACGYEADYIDFRSTPIGGELPRDHHQCPKCRIAWKMVNITKGEWHASGLYIPPGRKAVRIPSAI